MTKTQRIPWIRIGAESLATVGSILLAFAIDAWWGERLERGLESEQLSRLQAELEANLNRIDEWQIIELVSGAGLETIDRMEAAQNRGAQEIAIPAATLRLLSIAPTLEADFSVFDGLVRSGGLDVVEDRTVVSTLNA